MDRRRFLVRAALGSAAATVAGALLGANSAMARGRNYYYDGPASDHFDGTVFFNPGKPWTKGPADVLKWNLSREGKETWPDAYPSPFQAAPAPRVAGDDLMVTAIGHASLLLQTGGINILIDPVWSERASPFAFAGPKRVNPPGIAFADLPRIDVVLVTHNHYDHLDLATLSRLSREHGPRIITPLGNDTIMRAGGVGGDISAHDWGDAVALGNGMTVHLEESYHWSARGLFDRRHALWSAFVIKGPAGTVYHIGDTGYGDGRPFADMRRRHGAPRLAILPIGAYEPRWFMKDQHINPDEAVRIMRACGAQWAVGHHWGTFKLTDEGIERPLQALATALQEHKVDPGRFRPLRPGEAWDIPAASRA